MPQSKLFPTLVVSTLFLVLASCQQNSVSAWISLLDFLHQPSAMASTHTQSKVHESYFSDHISRVDRLNRQLQQQVSQLQTMPSLPSRHAGDMAAVGSLSMYQTTMEGESLLKKSLAAEVAADETAITENVTSNPAWLYAQQARRLIRTQQLKSVAMSSTHDWAEKAVPADDSPLNLHSAIQYSLTEPPLQRVEDTENKTDQTGIVEGLEKMGKSVAHWYQSQDSFPAVVATPVEAKSLDHVMQTQVVLHADQVNQAKSKTSVQSRSPLNPNHYEYRSQWARQAVDKQKIMGIAREMAAKYGQDPNLVLAIIEVESAFDPYAISHANAYGLMQIKPEHAGKEVFSLLHSYDAHPSPNYLFNSRRNIKMGVAYLQQLSDRYLDGVKSQTAREYLQIAAYNGGIGRVYRLFGKGKDNAIRKINRMSDSQLYNYLQNNLKARETRQYLKKVLRAKRHYQMA